MELKVAVSSILHIIIRFFCVKNSFFKIIEKYNSQKNLVYVYLNILYKKKEIIIFLLVIYNLIMTIIYSTL